jgi:Leucine-rich repeat (LRR) protein
MMPAKTHFLRFFFLSFCTFFSLAATLAQNSQYGQVRVRVFRSGEDSLQLAQVQKSIDEELTRKPLHQKKLDSLMTLQGKLYKEGITFKTVYRPGRDFVVTDSLLHVTDFSGITKVCVYGKHEIPAVLFRCRDLEALELVNTSIGRLPEALNSLPGLKSVYIYNNRSKKALRLSRNATITSLTITNENPAGLPRSYKKLKNLGKLDLAENGLTRFPNGARRNKKLTELSLQRNALTLKDRIRKHRYLERLSLHGNLIGHVPASIRNCRNLKKLNFNSNSISSVDDGIGALKKLEQLSFYSNRLTSVPRGIYSIKTLKEIDLFHNQIGQLDPEFSQWSNLVTLYLSHNKLVALPENIDTLRHLEGLYAWDNRLGKLPESVGNIAALKFLRVNNNYLKEIPASLLNLANLEELDISHNYITEVPEAVFDYPRLRILAMVNNPWNEATQKLLPAKVTALRAKEVYVHVSDE